MGEAAEPQRVGPVEVGQHIGGPLLHRLPASDGLARCYRVRGSEVGDELGYAGAALGQVRFVTGNDQPLIHLPGDFDLVVVLYSEQSHRLR